METRNARLTLLIDPEKKKSFERLCAEQDVTPSQLIRKFIREYIDAHAPTPAARKRAKPET